MKKNFFLLLVFSTLIMVSITLMGWWDELNGVVEWISTAISIASMSYVFLLNREIDGMKKQEFVLTLGLRAGYEKDAEIFTLSQAQECIQEWMQKRVNENLPILTGMIEKKTLIYPVRNNADGSKIISEPTAEYVGSLSPKYDKGRSEDEVIDTLNNLASYLANRFEQKRVYLSFNGRQWTQDF